MIIKKPSNWPKCGKTRVTEAWLAYVCIWLVKRVAGVFLGPITKRSRARIIQSQIRFDTQRESKRRYQETVIIPTDTSWVSENLGSFEERNISNKTLNQEWNYALIDKCCLIYFAFHYLKPRCSPYQLFLFSLRSFLDTTLEVFFFCERDVYDSFKVIGLSESALTKQGLYLLSIIPAQLVVRQITFIPGVHNGLLIAGVLQTHSVSK